MNQYRRLAIFSCDDVIDRLNKAYGFGNEVLHDLIDSVVINTWESISHNGIDWIHGSPQLSNYIRPEEMVAESAVDLAMVFFPDQDNDDYVRAFVLAALEAYQDIPHVPIFIDIMLDLNPVHSCGIHWVRNDLYVGFL